jgi:hypothetical protein
VLAPFVKPFSLIRTRVVTQGLTQKALILQASGFLAPSTTSISRRTLQLKLWIMHPPFGINSRWCFRLWPSVASTVSSFLLKSQTSEYVDLHHVSTLGPTVQIHPCTSSFGTLTEWPFAPRNYSRPLVFRTS